jgi:hypothetical protein
MIWTQPDGGAVDIYGHHVFHAVLLRFELTMAASYTHSPLMTIRKPAIPDGPCRPVADLPLTRMRT